MAVISFSVFLFILIHGITKEGYRQVRKTSFDGRLIMSLNFAIIYGFCPIAVFFFKSLYEDSVNIFGLYADPAVVLKISIAILLSYIVCNLTYKFGFESNFWRRSKFIIDDEKRAFALKVLYAIMFAMSALSLKIYTDQYGGFLRTVQLTGLIRQGLQDAYLDTEGSFIFVQNFTTTAFLAAVIGMSIFAANRRMSYLALLVPAVVLSALVLMILGSRGQVLILALMLVFSWMQARYPRGTAIRPAMIAFLLVLVLVADYFIGVGKLISASLYRNDLTPLDVIRQYKYVPLAPIVGYYREYIASLVAAFSYKDLDYSYFYDSFQIPLYLVPSRLFGLEKPETIVTLNTYLTAGIWEAMSPPGLVGYGYYSLGYAGIAISSAIYAYVLGVMDRLKQTLTVENSLFPIIYVPFILYWGIYFFQGDPKNLVITMTPTAILFGFVYVTMKRMRAHLQRSVG